MEKKMTPFEFLQYLENRCAECVTLGPLPGPAGALAQGRNDGLREVQMFIGKYLRGE